MASRKKPEDHVELGRRSQDLKKMGRSEVKILKLLAKRGELTHKELAELSGLEESVVTRCLEKLLRLGLAAPDVRRLRSQ